MTEGLTLDFQEGKTCFLKRFIPELEWKSNPSESIVEKEVFILDFLMEVLFSDKYWSRISVEDHSV